MAAFTVNTEAAAAGEPPFTAAGAAVRVAAAACTAADSVRMRRLAASLSRVNSLFRRPRSRSSPAPTRVLLMGELLMGRPQNLITPASCPLLPPSTHNQGSPPTC